MNNIIEIQEDVQIGNILLEKGDRIEVLEENYKYYYNEIAQNLPVDQYGIQMKIGQSKFIPLNKESLQALNDFFNKEMR